MRTLRNLHKWLGLLIFLQVLVWIGSGLVISLVDAGVARGSTTLEEVQPLTLDGLALLPWSALELPDTPIETIRLALIDDAPVYRVASQGAVVLLHAGSGERFRIDRLRAERIARASYRGEAEVIAVDAMERPPALPKFEGEAWRVRFDDALATDVYIDASDGRMLGHRNSRSTLVEFLLMLHFMDYTGGHDFNHPLIIIAAVLALWLTLSGVLLLIGSIRRVGLR